MNYKAYRTEMIAERTLITLAACGAALCLMLISMLVGILVAVSILFVGLISVLFALGREITYTVYNTRIVIKVRGNEKRVSVPVPDIVGVKYKKAFYEKRFSTSTVTVYAKIEKGRRKKYKLKHVFGAQPAVDFLRAEAEKNRKSV